MVQSVEPVMKRDPEGLTVKVVIAFSWVVNTSSLSGRNIGSRGKGEIIIDPLQPDTGKTLSGSPAAGPAVAGCSLDTSYFARTSPEHKDLQL